MLRFVWSTEVRLEDPAEPPRAGRRCGKPPAEAVFPFWYDRRRHISGGRVAMPVMRRRAFLAALGGAAAAWPLAVHAQQPAMPVVGFLSSISATDRPHHTEAFRQG